MVGECEGSVRNKGGPSVVSFRGRGRGRGSSSGPRLYVESAAIRNGNLGQPGRELQYPGNRRVSQLQRFSVFRVGADADIGEWHNTPNASDWLRSISLHLHP